MSNLKAATIAIKEKKQGEKSIWLGMNEKKKNGPHIFLYHISLPIVRHSEREKPAYLHQRKLAFFVAERRCMYSLIDFFVVWCGGYLLILHSADCDYILCLSNGQAKEFCLI